VKAEEPNPKPEIAMFQSLKNVFRSESSRRRPARRALHVEGLETRELMTAGITLGSDGIIHVEGHDDANQGETVTVRTLNNNTLSQFDDKVEVRMTYGRKVIVESFDLWKSNGRGHTPAVTRVDYNGLAGNDRFTNASSIAATADGGAGDDVLKGGSGNEVLIGGLGNDTLTGGLGNEKMDGGAGTDKLVESGDVNITLADNGMSGLGFDIFAGIEVADLTGGDSANVIDAHSFSGAVTISGGLGNDIITGGRGNDFLYGGDGSDTVSGMDGDDYIDAGTGDDKLYGGTGSDKLYGMDGADTIDAGMGNDKLYGGDGSDTLYGMEGDDDIYAGRGKDYLYGGAGDDYLDGGYDRKVDHLYGEAGTDEFLEHHWHDTDSMFVWEWESHKDKVHDKEAGEQVYIIWN
jgi:Ca2+-binding RTX toxin-like protein